MHRFVAAATAFWGGTHALAWAQARPPDLRFDLRMVDGGASETAAFADLNNDRRLEILSSDACYEAPSWTKHTIREVRGAPGSLASGCAGSNSRARPGRERVSEWAQY